MQRDLPQKQPLVSLYRAAPRSRSSQRDLCPKATSSLPESSSPAKWEHPSEAPSPLPLSSRPAQQELPHKAASSLPQSSSPAQWEYPTEAGSSFSNQAAPHSGSSTKAASSLPLSSGPAQRELPRSQKQPLLSLYQADPRSGSSLPNYQSSILYPSIQQPRAVGAASCLTLSSSPP